MGRKINYTSSLLHILGLVQGNLGPGAMAVEAVVAVEERFYDYAGSGQDFQPMAEVVAHTGWEKEVPK